MKVEIFDCKQPMPKKLYFELRDFEHENLKPIMIESEMKFNDERRFAFFKSGEILLICRNNENELLGFIEFGNHISKNIIYITSFQISKSNRRTVVFSYLAAYMIEYLKDKDFDFYQCRVHKCNKIAFEMYQKMGFVIIETEEKKYLMQVDKNAMFQNRFKKIYKRVFGN